LNENFNSSQILFAAIFRKLKREDRKNNAAIQRCEFCCRRKSVLKISQFSSTNYKQEKNDFAEGSKILLDTDLKIILLEF